MACQDRMKKPLTSQQRLLHQNAANLASVLVHLRARSQLTQAQVAARMSTTQTAIARLESGRQSASMQTLQNYARATGYRLEISFSKRGKSPGTQVQHAVVNGTRATE